MIFCVLFPLDWPSIKPKISQFKMSRVTIKMRIFKLWTMNAQFTNIFLQNSQPNVMSLRAILPITVASYSIIPHKRQSCCLSKYQNYYQSESMSKDIQMFEISDKEEPIGTEVFDANLPSNIDFDNHDHDHQHEHVEKVPFNPEKVGRLGKVITIGYELKSYRVLGKPNQIGEPLYFKGALVNAHLQTFAAKIFDQVSSGGFKKLWESLLGYSKREIAVTDGYMYILQGRKDGLFLHQVLTLTHLFKIFIDPEQDKIRLVFEQGQRLLNKDLSPDHFILFLEHLAQELSRLGLGLQE